jgi:nucleotide-binding universal stress UspA family protein
MDDVLVPHDLSEFSDRGLEVLGELGMPFGRLHVVHVLPRIDLTYPGVVWSKDEDDARRTHALRALEVRLQGTPYADASLHVVIGDPAARVVEVAREIEARLIVIPSHGRTGLQRMVLGSVAEHVARFAPCPVLVLPPSATLHPHPQPQPGAPHPRDRTPDEQIDALGSEITDRVARRAGYLTAVRIGLPDGADADWWEGGIQRRMSDAGIDYVDITFSATDSDHAVLLDTRFEEQ